VVDGVTPEVSNLAVTLQTTGKMDPTRLDSAKLDGTTHVSSAKFGVKLDGTTLTSSAAGVGVNFDPAVLGLVTGKLGITGLDLSKALAASYNSTDLHINPTTGKLEIAGVDLSKAISATLTNELIVSGNQLGINVINAAKINTGTLGALVVYAGSITASQIVTGTIASNIVYAGTINAGQINAGTINVALTLNAATINSGAINSSTLVGGSLTITNSSNTITIDASGLRQTHSSLGQMSIWNGTILVQPVGASGTYSAAYHSPQVFGLSDSTNNIVGTFSVTSYGGSLNLMKAATGSLCIDLAVQSGGYGLLRLRNASNVVTLTLDASTGTLTATTVNATSGFQYNGSPGQTAVISYAKPGGGTGSLTFYGGILTSYV